MVQPADDAEDTANELRYLGRILALWERVLAPDVLSLNRARRDLCERCSANQHPYRDRISDKRSKCLSS